MKRITTFLFLCFFLFFGIFQDAHAKGGLKENLVATTLIQPGISWPMGGLGSWLDRGEAIRFKIFGGVKLPAIKFIGSVGLGIDFTYAQHKDKARIGGFRYRRFVWDWFTLPVSIAGLTVTPGLNWVVTDLTHPEKDINETSIRPGGTLTLGAPFALTQSLFFRLSFRAEWVVSDREKAQDGSQLNLTGPFATGFGGFEFRL